MNSAIFKFKSIACMVMLTGFSLVFASANSQTNTTSHNNEVVSASFNHQGWESLLKRFVVDIRNGASTEVDYAGFLRERAALKTYLNQLGAVSEQQFLRWPANEQLAFLINAYNAWTVELILTRYPDLESIKDIGSWFRSPWSRAFISLLGEERSLDNIEHDLIRGSDRYNEPRIHFAVNCASIGCPALRAEAYTGTRLDRQLEDQTRRFLGDATRNRVAGNRLALSAIFKWYRDDFETPWRGTNTLHGFIERYADAMALDPAMRSRLRAGKVDFTFLDYDWRLNARQ